MKYVVLFFTILVSVACGAQQKGVVVIKNEKGNIIAKTIGIGRLQVSLNHTIPLYRAVNDVEPFDSLLFSIQEDGELKGSFLAARATKNALNPMSFYRGDSETESADNINSGLVYFAPTLVFRMTALADGGFEVILDEETFEGAIIKQDDYHTLYTEGKAYWTMSHSSNASDHPWFLRELWGDYFKRLMYLYLDTPQIYDAPNGSLIYTSKYNVGFSIKELVEEWARVETLNPYREEESAFPKEGWIRWTDGKTLLVNPVEAVYY